MKKLFLFTLVFVILVSSTVNAVAPVKYENPTEPDPVNIIQETKITFEERKLSEKNSTLREEVPTSMVRSSSTRAADLNIDAGTVEINSFEDLKPYIVKDNVPYYYSLTPMRDVLRLRQGKYILKSDILIDENDSFFDPYRDLLENGLFYVSGNFELDGQNHKIVLAKDKAHSLFEHIEPHKDFDAVLQPSEQVINIHDLTVEYENDVLGYGLAASITGLKKKNTSNNVTTSDSAITNVKINVKGSVLPKYLKRQFNTFVGDFDGYFASGLSVYLESVKIDHLDINVAKNIGSSELPSEEKQRVMSVGLAHTFASSYASAGVQHEQIDLDNPEFLNLQRINSHLLDSSLTVGGDIVATGWSYAAVAGGFHSSGAYNSNFNLNVKGNMISDMKGATIPVPGVETSYIYGFANEMMSLSNSNINIDGKFIMKEPSTSINTNKQYQVYGIGRGNSLGYYTKIDDNHVNILGGVDLDINGQNTVFFAGLYSNIWVDGAPLFDFRYANNTSNYGDMRFNLAGNLIFAGDTIKKHNVIKGALNVSDNNNTNIGNVNITSEKYVYFMLYGNYIQNEATDEEFKRVPINNHKLTYGDINIKADYARFNTVHYLHEKLSNIKVKTGNVNIQTTSGSLSPAIGGICYFPYSQNWKYVEKGIDKVDLEFGDFTVNGKANAPVYFGLGIGTGRDFDLTNIEIKAKNLKLDFPQSEKNIRLGGLIGNAYEMNVASSGVNISSAEMTSNNGNINFGGVTGYDFSSKYDNTSFFANDSIKVKDSAWVNVGGHTGVGYASSIKNSTIQIGENIIAEENISNRAYLGGFIGNLRFYTNKASIENSSSLVFGDIKAKSAVSAINAAFAGIVESKKSESGYSADGAEIKNSSAYIGGSLNTAEPPIPIIKGGAVGYLAGGTIDNFTLLIDVNNRGNQLLPENYLSGEGFAYNNNKIVLVDGEDRVGYDFTVEDISNKLKIEDLKNKTDIGKIKIALRTFQDKFWGLNAEKYDLGHEEEGFSYLKDSGGLTLSSNIIYSGPDVIDGATKLTLKDYFKRNLYLRDTNGTVFDLLGIKSDIKTVSVKFDKNFPPGTETILHTVEVNQNTSIGTDMPANPDDFTQEGNIYTFKEWNTKSDGTGDKFTGDTVVNNNITVFAIWTSNPNKVSVKFDKNFPPGTETILHTVEVNQNTSIGAAMPANPDDFTQEGNIYTFKEWNTKSDGTGDKFTGDTVVNDNITVFAIWTSDIWTSNPNKVNVKFDKNFPPGTETILHTVEVNQNTPIGAAMPANPSNISHYGKIYIFKEWNTKSDGTGDKFTRDTVVNDNITVFAIWVSKEPITSGGSSHEDRVIKKDSKKEEILEKHHQYIYGYPDRTMKPNGDITRAEVATIIARLTGISEDETGTPTYHDIKPNHWYAKYIKYLEDKNIIKGYPDGSFKPDKSITRAEFAAIAHHFSDKLGQKTFNDVENHWAKEKIGNIASQGWIQGYPDGSYKPNQNITRAEAARITNQVFNRHPDKIYIDLKEDIMPKFTDLNKAHWGYYELMEAAQGHEFVRMDKTLENWRKLLK